MTDEWFCIKIDPQTMTQYVFKVCHPLTNTVPDLERDRQIKLQTPHFRTYSRRE